MSGFGFLDRDASPDFFEPRSQDFQKARPTLDVNDAIKHASGKPQNQFVRNLDL